MRPLLKISLYFRDKSRSTAQNRPKIFPPHRPPPRPSHHPPSLITTPAFSGPPNQSRRRSAEAASPRCRHRRHSTNVPFPAFENQSFLQPSPPYLARITDTIAPTKSCTSPSLIPEPFFPGFPFVCFVVPTVLVPAVLPPNPPLFSGYSAFDRAHPPQKQNPAPVKARGFF